MARKSSSVGFIILSLMPVLAYHNVPAQEPNKPSTYVSTPMTSGPTETAVTAQKSPIQTSGQVKIINIVPEFLTFWSAAQSKDEATQVKMFRQIVIAPHPELFAQNVVDLGQDKGDAAVDHRIATYLKAVAPFIPAIRLLNDRLNSDLKTYSENFANVFSDYTPNSTVYFTVSLGSFDGAGRDVGGHRALLFGVDVIAGLYGPNAKLSVLFDHELFHQYHTGLDLPSYNDDGELWRSLWEEGLATYVSWRMNPLANENDVLLNQTLAAHAGPLLPSLASDLLANVRSNDPNEYAKFFLANSTTTTIPARSGYFVGFRVATQIGQNHTLLELAHMHGPQLEKQVEESLKSLESQCHEETP